MSEVANDQRRRYGIRELTRLTGLNADVLRVWERRYGFPRPARDATGARSYAARDLEKLGLVQQALQRGHRVSHVIAQSPEALIELLQPSSGLGALIAEDGAVKRILEALLADDDVKLVWELRYAALNLGAKAFITDVAARLVALVGDAWQDGRLRVRHEHLLTDALTTQLRVMSAAQGAAEGGRRVLLATLPGELHALGLEMLATYLTALGTTARSLGASAPPEEIAQAAVALNMGGVAVSVSLNSDVRTSGTQLARLAERIAGRVRIAIGGAGAALLPLPPGVERLTDWQALERWTEALPKPNPQRGK
jgi:methanogenic corrinoid protein MtbC1